MEPGRGPVLILVNTLGSFRVVSNKKGGAENFNHYWTYYIITSLKIQTTQATESDASLLWAGVSKLMSFDRGLVFGK